VNDLANAIYSPSYDGNFTIIPAWLDNGYNVTSNNARGTVDLRYYEDDAMVIFSLRFPQNITSLSQVSSSVWMRENTQNYTLAPPPLAMAPNMYQWTVEQQDQQALWTGSTRIGSE